MRYIKILFGIVVTVLISVTTMAQGILPAAGFVSNGEVSLVFSAGETIVGEFGNESISLAVVNIPDLSVIPISNEVTDGLPKEFGLSQNYPNPFNPSTTIRYALPKAADVSIEVFNILGKRVGSLVNQRKSAGNYTTQFQASNLSSGVYFYTLRINGKVLKSQKMLLIK